MTILDTNVYLSRWPARRLPGDETATLVEKLRAKGVTQAWAGSFDALLHNDIGGVNSRLAEECKWRGAVLPMPSGAVLPMPFGTVLLMPFGTVLLMPFGTVNPLLPDWEEDLRRCHEIHNMPGLRLHPNYHGYKLDDPAFEKLLALAAERQLIVQIALRMEDTRTQHRLLTVPDVDPTPLVQLLPKYPKLRVQLLNALTGLRPDLLDKLVAAGDVSVEIAMLEGINGIQKLLTHVPQDRVLFGSYFPFYAWEAAELKLRESPLAAAQRTAITATNAERLLKAGP
jgi:uncharacterized protein